MHKVRCYFRSKRIKVASLIIIGFLSFSNVSFADHTKQDSYLTYKDSIKKTFIIGVKPQFGTIIIHTDSIKHLKGSHPKGIEVDFSWHLNSRKAWEYCYRYPRAGLMISYFNFDNPSVLGYGINTAFYIEPFFSVDKKLNFSMRAGFGVNYLSTPYHHDTNNLTYSSHVSFIVIGSVNAYYKLSEHFRLNFSANLNHISNGGIKLPNKGLNIPTASIGFDYVFREPKFEKWEKPEVSELYTGKKRYDLTFYYSNKMTHPKVSRGFNVFGISFEVSKQIRKLSALTKGAEWIQDHSIEYKISRNINKDDDYQLGGVLFGHEFLICRVVFSQKFGVYFYDPSRYYDIVYQRLGLNFFITDHIFTGFNLKIHRATSEFIDIRIGWSF